MNFGRAMLVLFAVLAMCISLIGCGGGGGNGSSLLNSSLKGKLDHVTITPAIVNVQVGKSQLLTVSAYDGLNNTLVLTTAQVSWTSSNPITASLSASSATATVTGVNANTSAVSITATVTEGSVAKSATISVYVNKISASTNATDSAAMVWAQGGTFTMGTEFGAVGAAPHTQQVTLSGFWIYKNDVTVAQYMAYCAATGHAPPPWPGNMYSWAGKSGWTDPTIQQHPIVNVSWADATAYAAWAKAALPTEAQWEYAARGPAEYNYPWGGTATASDQHNGWDQTKCANSYNSGSLNISTWPVGSFPAGVSWCGALDMAGNVWQWCQDWYGPYSATPVTNPTGPASGTCRVLRGGSWDFADGMDACRSAFRYNSYTDIYGGHFGFRCVSTAPAP